MKKMPNKKIEGVTLAPLRIIDSEGGDVLHGLKSNEVHFQGFGEVYFSKIDFGSIKAWKRHRKMTMNLIVPVGTIKFVIFDDRDNSKTKGCFQSIELSTENYKRLNIPPMLWVGFQGKKDGLNMLINIANIPHDPEEADNIDKKEIDYDWDE